MGLSGFYDPLVFGERRTAGLRDQSIGRPGKPLQLLTEHPIHMATRRLDQDPERPVYVISVAAGIVSVHPRTLRIYEDEGLDCAGEDADQHSPL